MNALTDEVLGSVISRLEPKERIGVEAVSGRWRRISRQYAWRAQTHLNGEMLWNAEDKKYGQCRSVEVKREIIRRRLKCFVERCSAYLREVQFIYFNLDQNAIEHLITASNLTTLEFYWFPLTAPSAVLIGKLLPELETLHLIECFESLGPSEGEQALTAILKGCRCLQELYILSKAITGETSFAHFPPTLRSLNIGGCRRLCSSATDHLISACAHGQLRELNVSHLSIDCPILARGRLFEELPMLEKLVYGHGPMYDGGGGGLNALTLQQCKTAMSKIGTMKRLKSLELCHNALITDEALGAILDRCEELEEFIFFDRWGDDGPPIYHAPAGLRLLAQLPKLTHLALNNMPRMSEEMLLTVTSEDLKKLSLRLCPLVTDSTIERVLERCGKLRDLDVSFCEGLTKAAIKTIGEFVAGIAAESVKFHGSTWLARDEHYFRLLCEYSSIKTSPGELELEIKAAHPMLKYVRQYNEKGSNLYGADSSPSSLHIRW